MACVVRSRTACNAWASVELDIAFVHDILSDNKLLPTSWQEQFAIALEGAFPALSRMREEGIIKGWVSA